jgi:hypothetical protein
LKITLSILGDYNKLSLLKTTGLLGWQSDSSGSNLSATKKPTKTKTPTGLETVDHLMSFTTLLNKIRRNNDRKNLASHKNSL